MSRRPTPLRTDLPRAVLLDPNDGCLTIARRLATRGVEVVAVVSPATAWVGRSNTLRAMAVDALSASTAPQWLTALSVLADRPGVLICGSDASSEFVAAHREAIPEVLRSFEASSSAHRTVMDKDQLYALARKVGVRVPASFRIEERGDGTLLERAAQSAPCVAKPVLGHVARRSGDFATRRLPDAAAVRAHVGAAMDAGIPMLISEDVPGPTTALEGVITIRAADGSYSLEMSRRKVRDYAYGVGTLFESYPSPEAIGQARLLLEVSDYIGVAATEFKRHAVTGELYLIEINVRIPQSFGVSEAAGLDSSWRLYATLAGLPVTSPPTPRYGTKAWMPQHDLRAIRERHPRPGSWEVLASLRGVRDFGGLSWRDPRPGLRLARIEATRLRAKLSRGQ